MKDNKPKFNFWGTIEWLGTIFSITAAVSMALFGQTHVDKQLYIFGAYFLGSAFWMAAGIKTKKSSIWTMNLVFLFINTVGIANRI